MESPWKTLSWLGGLFSFSIRGIRAGGCLALNPYSEKHGSAGLLPKLKIYITALGLGFILKLFEVSNHLSCTED